MRLRVPFLLAPLGLFALLGCSDHDHHHHASSSYLVKAIAVSDVDANGQPDILGMVSTDYDGSPTQGYVTTRLQIAAGDFAMPIRFGVGRDPGALAVTDLNGDGRPDLVAANAEDQTVSVRLADPARPGFFQPAVVLSTPGRRPLGLAVTDLNGDGRMDLVVAASGGSSVLAFPQDTTPGTFLPPYTFSVGGDPQAVAVADLDGNGVPDIAAATSANQVSVLYDILLSPTFVPPTAVDYPTGIQPTAIQVADVNGDGRLDLLTANYGAAQNPATQGLSVIQHDAAARAYLAPVHYATGYRSAALAVGDLNGDGRPDVVVANAGLPGDPGSVSVLLQDPASAGALSAATEYRGVWGPMGVALGDMDGDGLLDLVLADGDIVVRLNRDSSPGTFGPPNFFYN